MSKTGNVVNIGGKSLAESRQAGETFVGTYKGGDVTERVTPEKEIDGPNGKEKVSYRLAFIPMEIEIDGQKRTVSVVANGRFTEAANKPKKDSQFTVMVDSRDNPKNEDRPYKSFQMAE